MSAFDRVNLSHNPFGELSTEQWVASALVDVEAYRVLLEQPGTALQFLGRCGRGKTTHLRAVCAATPRASWVRARVEPPIRAEIRVVDEFDSVWPWTRWQHVRGARSVAVATHRDQTTELRLYGFRVHTVEVTQTDLERLQQIVQRRILVARRGPGSVPSIPRSHLAALHREHGDDIRAIMHALYGWFQNAYAGESHVQL